MTASDDANAPSETTDLRRHPPGGAPSDTSHEVSAPREDLRDRRLGDFRLLRRLGRGGMAEVYLAEQCSMSRNVALKVLRPELVADDVHLKRFSLEARTAGGLNHPNIVQVYTIGEADGVHYIAQEYVQGINLAQYLQRNGPPDLRVALHIMKQAALALQAAGEAGIVHRDIKPENILITGKGTVKVADFGLARLTLGERVNLTQDGITMGTPLYMSPEQINGRELDKRTDIYSFGVTCYHLLAGRPPFRGETAMSLAVKHVNEKAAPLDRIRTDLPPALCRLVERMMAKSPGERPADANALLLELKRISSALGEEPSATALNRLARIALGGTAPSDSWRDASAMRKAVLVAAGCLVVAAAAAFFGWLSRPGDPFAKSGEATSVPKAESAVFQLLRAARLDTEEEWLAVEHHFPHETHDVDRARAQLARLYAQTDRIDEAAAIFESLASPAQADLALRARGYAGLAVIACLRQDFTRSHRIITQELLPSLQEHLDEKSRLLVIEAIARNRTALGNQVETNLEDRFPPPPER